MSSPKIVYNDYCIAARVGDTIVLNKDLFRFDKVWAKKVLDHELRHSGNFSLKDFGMDLFEGDFFKNVHFLFKHPKAVVSLLPVRIFLGELVFDPNLLIIYSLIIFLLFFYLQNFW